MARLGLERGVVDHDAHARATRRLREGGIVLPTFAQLADPTTIPPSIAVDVAAADFDTPHPRDVPLIHNVMATDIVVAISDRATDSLLVQFASEAGREHLSQRMGVPEPVIEALPSFGLSSICNVLAAIKVARQQRLGPTDLVATVATDGAELYASEVGRIVVRDHDSRFDAAAAARVHATHLDAIDTADMLVCGPGERERIFNLGYFTWVEQRGVTLEDFEARRSQAFWTETRSIAADWDALIEAMNAHVAA